MSIKIGDKKVVESKITSYYTDTETIDFNEKDGEGGYDITTITVYLEGGDSHTVRAFYNIREGAKINGIDAKEYIERHEYLSDEKEVKNTIKKLEKLK